MKKYILIHSTADGNFTYQFQIEDNSNMIDGFFWGGEMGIDEDEQREDFAYLQQIADQIDLKINMDDCSTSVEIMRFDDELTTITLK